MKIATSIPVSGKLFAAGALLLQSAFATVIDFETFPDGTPVPSGAEITTQYIPSGAVFSSASGGPFVIVGVGEASSMPNFMVGNPNSYFDITMDVVNPVTGLPSTAFRIDVTLISVGYNAVVTTAYAADLVTVLDTVVVQHLDGVPNGLNAKDPISLFGPGIARVTFDIQVQYELDGFGIDDISIDPPTVPDGGSAFVAALAMAGLAGLKRRRSRTHF